jgi:hypothetical protein
MEIKSAFLDGTADITVSVDRIVDNNEYQFEVIVNDSKLYMTREEWEQIKDFVDNSMDFLNQNY